MPDRQNYTHRTQLIGQKGLVRAYEETEGNGKIGLEDKEMQLHFFLLSMLLQSKKVKSPHLMNQSSVNQLMDPLFRTVP